MPTFIPEITKAYENDPRTKLAQALVQSGGNTGPVAGGGWAWADGIARALSGLAGGYVQHKQEAKYEKREQDMTNAVAAALAGNNGAAPGMPPQGMPPQGAQHAPTGEQPVPVAPPTPPPPLPDGPQAAPQGLPPSPVAQAPQAAPTAPQGPSPASQAIPAPPPMPAPPPGFPAAAPQIAAALGGGGAANPAAPFAPTPRVTGASVVQAMLPITAATESNNKNFTSAGKPVTSTKGARYAMQVMPATARKPGFGIKPAANDSPEEYNRVGTELLGKLTEKYGGDPAKAWAAYNGGTGRVDHALAKHGENWLAAMPAETQAYVKKNVEALGGTDPSQGPYYAGADAKELQPTGPIQYQTAEPDTPALPDRPADRGAAQSLRMGAGKQLLALKDPAVFERAMSMLDTGMGEQFAADRDALAENNNRDDTLYNAGVGDHFAAANQKRAAAYDTRGREQQEGYAYGREMRGYTHDDNTLASQQGFTHNERLGSQQFEAGQNALNRSAQENLTKLTIEGKHEDAQTKAAQKFQNFLSTPQGSKMYQESTNRMNNLDDIVNQVGAFMEINEKHPTGGMLMNAPTGAGEWFARNLSSNTQAMDAITQKIAPLMRQAGQGSMSDKDLAGFVRSVPNIKNTVTANRQAAARLKLGIARMNDFEINKLKAASEGRQVQFLQEWNSYKAQVPFDKGISFDDWKGSVPQYNADGSRK